MSQLTDYIYKLAQEFEEAIPPTVRSSNLPFKHTDRPIQIDTVPPAPMDETDIAYLQAALVFNDISHIAKEAETLLKSQDWQKMYDAQEGIVAITAALQHKLNVAKKLVKELP